MTLSLSRSRSASRRVSVSATLAAYVAVWGQRRALSNLSPQMLKDAGISPRDAAREAARPFWDLP
ncbi:MAG: DUF1127 domain-containing protein [Pseudomonadota bacterium]